MRRIYVGILLASLMLVAGGCGSDSDTKTDTDSSTAVTTTESTAESTAPDTLPVTFHEGLRKLEVDYEPVLYRAPGGKGCHWALLMKRSGGVVESGGAANTQTLHITTPYFESKGCGVWDNRYQTWGPPRKTIPDGVWKTSDDYEPGLYRAPGGDDCHWALLRSAHPATAIDREGKGAKPQTVEIVTSYFKTEGCGEWRKIG